MGYDELQELISLLEKFNQTYHDNRQANINQVMELIEVRIKD